MDPIAAPVVDRLAAQLLIAPEAIRVASVQPAEWPDACLGLPAEGEICAAMLTSGYTIVVAVGIDTYEFRTDATGEKIRLASAPPARTGDPLVTWRDAQSFNMMIIGTQRVATGRRGRPLIASPLAVPARATELQGFLAHFAPFEAKTPAGDIALRGVGPARPSEIEQRMIAEWARLVSVEARAGGERPGADLAMRWKWDNPRAGTCDLIEITRTGTATAATCRAGELAPIASVTLTADELGRLYAWLDRLEAFELAGDDAGPSLHFRGTGVDEVGDAERAAISAWIDGIAVRLRQAALQ